MPLQKQWVISCDEPGCDAFQRIGSASWDRWDTGMVANDAGWDASPGTTETYCRLHSKLEPLESRIEALVHRQKETDHE